MKNQENYIFPKKSELKQISINEVYAKLPDLKNSYESKATAIGKWLAGWITTALSEGKIEENNILPSKSDFAYMLGVSLGTVQNAIRYIEDLGYVESKQCIGTLVKDRTSSTHTMRKLTSKKDNAIEAIKRYILSNNFKVGDNLPSSRTISMIIGFNSNTTRLSLETLASFGIVSHNKKNARESGWIITSTDFELKSNEISNNAKTLVDMVVSDLENYITTKLKVGDKMPPHAALAKELKASIKTVHDALKVLIDRQVLLARRGRYGTTVIKIPGSVSFGEKPETSIFASAQETAFYHYEKTQNSIKKMIASEYQIGDKLPSIKELSERFDLSPNTIRKAFHNLAREGYLVFSRGRYGGTFVIDIPETEVQSFKWLAVNPQYAKEYSN
jgi:DNA-binding GntR family transcriptional regulator